jgi:hypothetical protein
VAEKLRCWNSRKGAIGKQSETYQHKANGLSPSLTFTHGLLNNYASGCRPSATIKVRRPSTLTSRVVICSAKSTGW